MNTELRNYLKDTAHINAIGGRRMYIKRYNALGYESEWHDITNLVTQNGFPKIKESIGDGEHLGEFKTNKAKIRLKNTHGDIDKMMSGFYSLIKSKFKLEITFQKYDGSSVLADRQYFYAHGQIVEKNNESHINLFPYSHYLKQVNAYTYLYDNPFTQGMSLSDMCMHLLGADNDGAKIFDRIFEGDSSTRYQIESSDFIPEDISLFNNSVNTGDTVYKLISRYCLFMGAFMGINSDGNFYIKKRNLGSVDEWHFNYMTSYDEFKNNVASLSRGPDLNNLFNMVMINYSNDGIYTDAISYVLGDGSNRDIHGDKPFNGSYDELTVTEAQTLGTSILTEYDSLKTIYNITSAKPVFLKPLDKVILNSEGPELYPSGTEPARYGKALYDSSVYTDRAGSINVVGLELMVIEASYNPNNFKFNVKARTTL